MKKTTLLLLFFATFKGFSQIIEHQRFIVSANVGVGFTLTDNTDNDISEYLRAYKTYELNAGYRLAFDGRIFMGLTYKKIDFNKRNYNSYENISSPVGFDAIPNQLKKDITFKGLSFMYKSKSFFKTADATFVLTPSYATLTMKNSSPFREQKLTSNTFGVMASVQNNYYLTENLSIGPKISISYAKFDELEKNNSGITKYTHLGAEINFNASYQF